MLIIDQRELVPMYVSLNSCFEMNIGWTISQSCRRQLNATRSDQQADGQESLEFAKVSFQTPRPIDKVEERRDKHQRIQGGGQLSAAGCLRNGCPIASCIRDTHSGDP